MANRSAWASLIVEGRLCGPRQNCEIVVDATGDVMSVRPSQTLIFPSDKKGDAWIKYYDKQGNYLAAVHLGKVAIGQDVRVRA